LDQVSVLIIFLERGNSLKNTLKDEWIFVKNKNLEIGLLVLINLIKFDIVEWFVGFQIDVKDEQLV
jgi:hypothetical protein